MGFHMISADVVVVGGGHAGCEAALAAARVGCRVLLITPNPSQVARLPCNPSIGGPAKAHLVREVDALGGEMARAIDATQIHIRNLNTGKGPAVQALRAQADSPVYSSRLATALSAQPGLEVLADLVEGLEANARGGLSLRCRSGRVLRAGACVLATGTFLGATLYMGRLRMPGGRSGEPPANGLGRSLRALGLRVGRLKTGTCPRIHRDSIDFGSLDVLPSSCDGLAFSDLSPLQVPLRHVECHLTRTTERTRTVVLDNLDRSPLYGGRISGAGPRYCPSLEDKFVRFPDRETHLVFLEPEGLQTPEVYLQGVSTSMPLEVQVAMVRSLPGLHRANLLRPGYAVEYDFVDPTQLDRSLQVRGLPGLFLAGQINGTSGYEEAAAQGVLAGLNAAHHVGGLDPVFLDRDQAYLGVLVDDLVCRGTREPYRMHTSRAEYRLLLRQENADERLTPLGRRLGLVCAERWQTYQERSLASEGEVRRLLERRVGEAEAQSLALRLEATVAPGCVLADLVRRPETSLAVLREWEGLAPLDPRVQAKVEVRLKYEGYIARQVREVAKVRRLEGMPIPDGLCFSGLAGVSTEAAEKWGRVRPVCVGQAGRIPGVSPSDVSALLVHLRRLQAAREEICGGAA